MKKKLMTLAAAPTLEGGGPADCLFGKAETQHKKKRPAETGRSGKRSAAGARKPQAPWLR